MLEGLTGLEGLFWQCWYLDDGILVGDDAFLLGLLPKLSLELAKLGLKINLAKCVIWSPESSLQAVEG